MTNMHHLMLYWFQKPSISNTALFNRMTCVSGSFFYFNKMNEPQHLPSLVDACCQAHSMPSFIFRSSLAAKCYKTLFKFINTLPSLFFFFISVILSPFVSIRMTDFFLEQWMYSENVCTVAPAVADKKEYETIHQICYCVRSYATLPLGFIPDYFCWWNI